MAKRPTSLNGPIYPWVIGKDLSAGYAAMAADKAREAEAQAWSEGTLLDVVNEPFDENGLGR